jgi:hypothetical protein
VSIKIAYARPLVAESDRKIVEAGYLPSQGTIGCEDDEEVGLDSRRSNEFNRMH